MLQVSRDPIVSPSTELRRTCVEDAPALFETLRDPEIYAYLPRRPPRHAEDLAAHFRCVMPETAPDRTGQWLNWTVWRRGDDAALGTLEATVAGDHGVTIGYVFGLAHRGQGYARESVRAMLEHLACCGARSFEAIIDARNAPSQRLAQALGFQLAATRGIDQVWRRGVHLP